MIIDAFSAWNDSLFRSLASEKTLDERDMNMVRGRDGLEWLLDYELRCAERYRRYVSVVMMASPEQTGGNLCQFLGDEFRKSDEVFELEHGAAIVMGETDLSDSIRAIRRFKAHCEGNVNLNCAVVSYPEDRGSARDIMTTLFHRLERANRDEAGSIITAD